MKLLTFLGDGKYSQTTYVLGAYECQAKFAPIASAVHLNADSITIFLTEEAQQNHFTTLCADLKAERPEIEIVPIPIQQGRNETELWQIFSQIQVAVEPDEEVAFDITHGLRSSPLLGLLAAAFLRSSGKIKLRGVFYGAYEVRDKENNRTPIFDLTPMIVLLDWSAAADRFVRTGDARFLASLVAERRKELALAAVGDMALKDQAGKLGHLSTALGDVSRSLVLLVHNEVMESVASLPGYVEAARPALERSLGTLPFSSLLQRVTESYQPLAFPAPKDTARMAERLEVERRMIHWYAEHEHWMQAISLSREWLVSWTMLHLNLEDLLTERENVEKILGEQARAYRNFREQKSAGEFDLANLRSVPQAVLALQLWLELSDRRNDIDHAGMREEPKSADTLIKGIEACIKKLDALPLQ